MKRRWLLRSAVLLVAGTVIEIVLVGAGMQPQLATVAVILVAVAAVGMLAFDLLAVAAPAAWPDNDAPEPPRLVLDSRTESLVRMVSREQEQPGPSRRLHPLLVSLIDHRLQDRHGIDRAADADAAAHVLGGPLSELVRTPPPGPQLASTASLARIVAAIETL